MDTAIGLDALTKRYGSTLALDGLSLEVRVGEVYGFLGPNGAGKSTTIRILLDLLRPDSGRATVLGLDAHRDAIALHRRIGYVPGDVTLWPRLTGGQTIDALLAMHGTRPDPARRAELIEAFGLDPSVRCRAYSRGNRQKVALVAAFAADSELLIMDEPTGGLDPLVAETFREQVLAARAAGRTVFLSSHVLSEVESVCDRVGIIRGGRLIDSGSLDTLRHLSARTVTAELDRRPQTDLATVPGVTDSAVEPAGDGFRLHCRVAPEGIGGLLDALAGTGVRDLTSRPPSLEELFLGYYGEVPVSGGAR